MMLIGKTVLVLEDEPLIGFVLEDLLAEISCSEVILVTQLDQAERALDTCSFDLAILDVNIHGGRSYRIADRLADANVPYIFATGYGDREHPERHRGIPTVTKPYSQFEVISALEAALSKRAS